MKRLRVALIAATAMSVALHLPIQRDALEQDRSYRVVFDLTSRDSLGSEGSGAMDPRK